MPFDMAKSPLNNCLFYIVITTTLVQLVTSSSRQGDLCLIEENLRGTCRKYEDCAGARGLPPSQNYFCRTLDGQETLICCRENDNKSRQQNGNRKKVLANALLVPEILTKDELVDSETIYDVSQVYEGTGSSDRKKHSISVTSYNRRQTNEANTNEPNHLRPGYNQNAPNLGTLDASNVQSTEFYSQTYPKPHTSSNRESSKPKHTLDKIRHKENKENQNSRVDRVTSKPARSQTPIKNDHFINSGTTKPARPHPTSSSSSEYSADVYQTHRRPTAHQTTDSNYHNYEKTTKSSPWQAAPRPLIEDVNGYAVPQPPRQPTTNKPPRHPKPTLRRISEMKCKDYSEMVTGTVAGLPLTTDPKPVEIHIQKCNYNAQQLIVGGQNTSVGEFPHMAAVGFLDRQRRTISWNCGGSLISEHFVLTAAHCTTSSLGSPSVVRLGEHNLRRGDDGAHPVDYLVKEVVRHPEYNPPVRYNDIALLRLSRPVTFTAQIRPACLFSRANVPHDKTIATGWGRIQYAEDQSDVLLKVVLSIINNRKCNELYQGESKTEVLSKGIVAQQICAGELTGGKDTCQGDSGGPIEITTQENKCIHHLIGVTSFGKRCAQANAPGVYTRVSSYLTWVESVVWPELVLALQTNASYPRS